MQPLIATLSRAVLREDAEFHTYQMLDAGDGWRRWGFVGTGALGHVLSTPDMTVPALAVEFFLTKTVIRARIKS